MMCGSFRVVIVWISHTAENCKCQLNKSHCQKWRVSSRNIKLLIFQRLTSVTQIWTNYPDAMWVGVKGKEFHLVKNVFSHLIIAKYIKPSLSEQTDFEDILVFSLTRLINFFVHHSTLCTVILFYVRFDLSDRFYFS